jgi:hypothetical protein
MRSNPAQAFFLVGLAMADTVRTSGGRVVSTEQQERIAAQMEARRESHRSKRDSVRAPPLQILSGFAENIALTTPFFAIS